MTSVRRPPSPCPSPFHDFLNTPLSAALARLALATVATQHGSQTACPLCNRRHDLARWDAFAQKSVSKRCIVDNDRYFRCLEMGQISRCPSTSVKQCNSAGCGGTHHQLYGSQRVFQRRGTEKTVTRADRTASRSSSVSLYRTIEAALNATSHQDIYSLQFFKSYQCVCTGQTASAVTRARCITDLSCTTVGWKRKSGYYHVRGMLRS